MKRFYQGVRYDITVKRDGKGNNVRLIVDGKIIEGNVVPKPAAGLSKVKVQAILM